MKLYIITGACGSGKSTMKDALEASLDRSIFACVDSDEVGLNWWDYAGTDHESQYKDDTLAKAVEMAEGKDLVFVSCINPQDYIASHKIPECVESTDFIVLCPSDEEIIRRLKARPAERGFTSDEKIAPHVGFNQWFRKNKGKFPMFIDNTNMDVTETSKQIAGFVASRR
ncbi:AAA family ATPase [Butyrivibrio sp. VCD2006]|uniref:AAA family ATPase n=1 Tax=Butyrivibrio sp. VCD2006 TaxID=1280664 RepID=UPI00042A719F|nr:AAA family ATPase [Butyrivibrio sp. VCD2006]